MYANNRFMERGVELQMGCFTYWYAKKQYMHSCMICCSQGKGGATKCATCPIRAAFLANCEVFDNRIPKEEKENFIQREKDLL